ncbi:hypothetical protein BU26DRAFT_514113 [Trematosphaeria pertusa]|uniref:Uncharacterized protein n=1 Tax=Trematosphaeria pertusa TaxID=390896 RepID=A0A6A6J402_9PLEO|nr:uncharacterized protein BU26DRAFT_514113 [Trematosphaeria pertusa]KAF2257429.1 hypothetical protein BU26DRAFT_514113 [Trematosphaeria pertusa]
MKAIEKFLMTNGRTTRIIVISICGTLRCLGHTSVVRDSTEVVTLDELAKPAAVQNWIAGLSLCSSGLRLIPMMLPSS